MPDSASSHRLRILFSFACVYLFWGSTYLAMRFGVEVLPPFVLGSARFLISGPLLLGVGALLGMKLRPSRKDLVRLAIIGILMLGFGNTAVIWAEQYIPTGLAALLVASIPLYAALIEMVLPNGEGLSARGWVGVLVGFAGLVFLLWPGLRSGLRGDSRQIVAGAVTLAGALSWTGASVISRRSKFAITGLVAAGWEMVFGGLADAAMMAATHGYHGAQWGLQAWVSVLYLVTFGSLVTYTAYIFLLDNVAVSKVATYAYVNPVVAVVLGYFVAGEAVGVRAVLGTICVLVSVVVITTTGSKKLA